MKTAIKALLATLRLAPAAQLEQLTRDLQRADAKLAQLEERLVQLRADAENWKRRYDDAADGVAGWKEAMTRTQREADRARDSIDRLKADLERTKADAERSQARATEWRARAEALTAELQDQRARLEDAQRATASSNEQLMAMEVKLDLIEAAIQVLDTRTREQVVSRSL
jgi:chromosome segregation ATPase